MSDPLGKLRSALSAVEGHLQDLQGAQSATTRELGVLAGTVKSLEGRSLAMEASLTALGGTFASIETILTELLADRQRLETVELTMTELARRVEALEKRAS